MAAPTKRNEQEPLRLKSLAKSNFTSSRDLNATFNYAKRAHRLAPNLTASLRSLPSSSFSASPLLTTPPLLTGFVWEWAGWFIFFIKPVNGRGRGSCIELGEYGLEREIKRLIRDRMVLMAEMMKLKQQQHNLREQLCLMESSVCGEEEENEEGNEEEKEKEEVERVVFSSCNHLELTLGTVT